MFNASRTYAMFHELLLGAEMSHDLLVLDS
jgi:hypothetical protein